MQNHIHPIYDRLLQRSDREKQLKQTSKVFWLTGLSGSGKSTVVQHAERMLYNQGYFAKVLDGDNVRTGLCKDLGFSLEDRKENTRRVAEVAKLFKETGVIILCSFISPTKEIRNFVRQIIGPEDFEEVYINVSLAVAEARDVKGLYAKARAGEIKGFTGIDSPYEAPEHPDLEIRTDELTIEDAAKRLVDHVLKRCGV